MSEFQNLSFHILYGGGNLVADSTFLLYLDFSLSLLQFQPIFELFVAISAFLWHCFKRGVNKGMQIHRSVMIY